MAELNPTLQRMSEAATVALADRVRRLRADGRPVIGLQTGDPDFPTPSAIVEAANRAMSQGQTHYCDSRGLRPLREALAGKLQRVNGVAYDAAREILVTCGGVHGYYCALQAVVGPEQEVLVPDPVWMTHANVASLIGRKVVRVPSSAETQWWPTLEAWERALSPRSAALVINSPNNPTGAVAPRDYLQELCGFANKHDLWVISDEVYENIVYDGRQHICFASLPGARERTILLNSFSKTYAMTGWRVGYIAAPARVIGEALKASQNSITNVAPFVQQAAAVALTDLSVAEESRRMARAYAARRETVLRIAAEHPASAVRVTAPEGAFYFFLDVRALERPSLEISERLLEEVGVALVPGSAYGSCGEGFLRMTIAASEADIQAGFRMLMQWAAQHESRKVAHESVG